MKAKRWVLSVLLLGALCLLLAECDPGVISDHTLKDRLTRNRADYDELVRLFNESSDHPAAIAANQKSPPAVPPTPPPNWQKIHDLLVKLKVMSITATRDETTIWITDSPFWDYAFVYSDTPPPHNGRFPVPGGMVPSLHEKTKSGTPYGVYYMHLQDNWYASMNEGTGWF